MLILEYFAYDRNNTPQLTLVPLNQIWLYMCYCDYSQKGKYVCWSKEYNIANCY